MERHGGIGAGESLNGEKLGGNLRPLSMQSWHYKFLSLASVLEAGGLTLFIRIE